MGPAAFYSIKMQSDEIDAYFQRIGFTGDRDVSLKNLFDMQLLHLQAVPFENLNIHLGRPIVVSDLSAIKQKVLVDKRGGYCFELNQLFLQLLLALGYEVTPRLARVKWMVPEGTHMGLTHLALIVKLDGKRWMVDVGAGPIGCPCPLDLDSDEVISTPYSLHRIVKTSEHDYLLQLLDAHDVWAGCYELNDALLSNPADWQIGSYYVSTHPESFFSQKILLGIYTTNNERAVMYTSEYTLRVSGGIVEKRRVASREEYFHMLREVFRLPVDQLEGLVVNESGWGEGDKPSEQQKEEIV